MLKSPSQYINCETSISSRPVRVSGETYGSAVIFFTPKIGDRNIDITALTCEFVQIIDRGEWGKEEVSYSVAASSSSNRKYHEFSFENECDSYELKFIPPSGLKLGIIEVFFDPDTIYTNSSSKMGDFNNPLNVTTDLSPVVAAITASSAAEVAATQAQTAAATRQVVSEIDSTYTATVWSNTPVNHIAVQPDRTRMGGSFYNTGTKPLAIDKFVDIATKTAAMQADGLIQPGGTYNFKPEEAGEGYLIYALTPGGTNTVNINLQK
jgi:hypothetical protein